MAEWVDVIRHIDLVTGPTAEPISTANMKTFLRVDHSTQDTLIDTLVQTARERVENDTGQALITQTWDIWLDAFPSERVFTIPKVPLASVTSIKSYDDDDTESTFSDAKYFVDTVGDRIALNTDDDWPTDLRAVNAAVIRVVVGYGATGASVPAPLNLAIYQLVTHWFEHADPVDFSSVSTAYTGHIAAYRNAAGIA